MGRWRGVEFPGTERFELRRKLGAGGMGVVYEAFDRERETMVALKTLQWASAASLYRFKREFRALADIEHPNLISLGELIEADRQWFFTMELVEGVDFLRYVRGERGPGDEGEQTATTKQPACDEMSLRSAARQLALAITALHQANRVHRDIKPSNTLVTREGRLVLLDFGLATNADADADGYSSTQSPAVGTAAYMAPEQALSGTVGPPADWYSLGVMIYEALTGQLPYPGASSVEMLMRKQQYAPPPPRARVSGVPEDLDNLCVDLLKRRPAERPTARAVLDRLGVDTGVVSVALTSSRFTQSMPFVGRPNELARLRRAFDASRARAALVVVEGESGVGKTELARHFTEITKEEIADTVVLAGRCYERESMPYKAFDGIADALARYMMRIPKEDAAALLPLRASLLPRLFPVLQRVEVIGRAPRGEETLDPQELRRRMFGALRELLARLAQRHPLILVIDDLQWTDADSRTLMQEVLSHPEAPNLLLIATMRVLVPPEREEAIAAVHALGPSDVITLATLPQETAMELAALLLPGRDEAELAAVAREAGGHPLFLLELARYSEASPVGVTASLDEMLWSRIAKLGRERHVLEIVSAAGTPITQEVAANAAELEFEEYVRAASALRVGYFLRSDGVRRTDHVTTYHDRVREVVLSHLEEATRRYHHERLAVALESAGAAATNPHALVQHAEASGDAARAADYAELAAKHAVNAMAFDRAAQFLQAALRLGRHDDEESRALRLSLADVFVNAGRGPEAAAMFIEAAKGAEPATRLECQRGAAEQWLISGHIDRGLDAMTGLLGEIGVRIPATPQRALFSLLRIRARLYLRGYRWKETPRSQIPVDVLTRIDVFKAAGHGLGIVDTIRGADFQARGLLLALRTGEPFRVARALFYEASFVATQGGAKRLARAAELVERAERAAPRDPYLVAWKLGAAACVDYFGSRFRRAADGFADAEMRFRAQAAVAWELSTIRLFQLWSLLRMGAFREMAPLIDAYVRDADRRGDVYARTTVIRSCHPVWLARDRLDEAIHVLDEATWAPSEGRYHLQHFYALRAKCEIDLYRGSTEDLLAGAEPDYAALKKSLLLRIITVRSESRWLRGRLALASMTGRADAAARLREARRMARLLEREQDVYASTSALLLRAAIASQLGDEEGARTTLAEVVTSAEEVDLFLHAAAARRRLGALVGGDEGRTLVAQADEWMNSEGIANPERTLEVVAPGFDSRS